MNSDNKKTMGKEFILVVEDDINLRSAIADVLESEGYDVMSTGTGHKANDYVNKFDINLIVLDINLPDTNGFDLCRQWRSNGVEAMILMLTAKDQEEDMLTGFKVGTDDYIVKPYPLTVFLSRVEALLRRGRSNNQPGSKVVSKYSLSEYEIDLNARRVISRLDHQEIVLTQIEFDLLIFLVENKNRALSYDEITNTVWGENIIVVQGAIRNTISSIRKKLEEPNIEQLWNIVTIRGIGYRLEVD